MGKKEMLERERHKNLSEREVIEILKRGLSHIGKDIRLIQGKKYPPNSSDLSSDLYKLSKDCTDGVSIITRYQKNTRFVAPPAPPKVLSMQCAACKFYFSLGPTTGQCRRYPPRALDQSSPIDEDNDRFPTTCIDVWCGEFQSTPLKIYPSRADKSSPRSDA